MDPEQKKQLDQIIGQLPQVLQRFIRSGVWLQETKKLETTYLLTKEQSEALETEVFLLLIGLVQLNEVTENLRVENSISQETAVRLTNDLKEKVLFDVINTLEIIADQENSVANNNKQTEAAVGGVEMVTTDNSVLPEDTETESKEELLHGIEEPESILPEIAPQNLPMTTNKSDSLVSSAMSKPTITPKENTPAQKISAYKAVDPYRESLD